MTEHMEASYVRETADLSNTSLFQSALDGSSGFLQSASKEVDGLTGKGDEAVHALPSITIEGKPKPAPGSGLSHCEELQEQGYKINCLPEVPKKKIDTDSPQDSDLQDQSRQNRKKR